MKAPVGNGFAAANLEEGEKKRINSELWHACAGPLVSLPPVGSLVVYFPQGHSEQVATSMQKEIDCIPNYPSLPAKLICVLHDVTLHADPETDEVYAQMTLQPVNKYDREAMIASEMGLKQNKQPADFFCKTLTASDTSTHGGFSVPRRAAEKMFPPLDFTMQPPAQELVAKDLHDISWTFRHIYRGQPKRHLLTTGWSVFVSTKRLTAGDSVLFIRDEKSQFLLGIRRANRQQPPLSSSVLSSDSMHIGILAAAAHAATNNSPFTIFYNPRASPSEFVIPLAKYNKAMYTQVSLGMRFRMMFETEECGVRRYMGTVTGISDLDPLRWKNSQWRNLQVGWDESTATERRTRVSLWEIEPVATPFYICPPPPFFRPKFPKQPDDAENAFQRAMPWLNDELVMRDAQSAAFPGLSLVQWMALQQSLSSGTPSALVPPISTAGQDSQPIDDPTRILNFQTHASTLPNLQSSTMLNAQSHQQDQANYPPHQVIVQQTNLLPQTSLPPDQSQQLSILQQKALQMQQQHLQPQQELLQHHLLPHQLRTPVNQELKQIQTSSGQLAAQTQLGSQVLQSAQLQRQLLQVPGLSNLVSNQASPSSQNFQVQQALESQNAFVQKQQEQLQQLNQAQLQMQLLQKLQNQEVLPQLSPKVPVQLAQKPTEHPPLFQQRQNVQQQLDTSDHNQLFQQRQNVQQPLDAAEPSQLFQQRQNVQQLQDTTQLTPEQRQLQLKLKSQLLVRTQSTLSATDVPSSSNPGNYSTTSLSSQNKFLRGLESSVVETVTPPIDDLLNELQSKPEARGKHEHFVAKESTQPTNHNSLADQLDASSTTSFCFDSSGRDGFPAPPYSECNVQMDHSDEYFVGANADALMPDALLSRGLGSDISSQSFGVADMTFKAGCSNDAANQNGALNRGMWSSQPQRMRTYTKVQKRGSVGRCIDVTRYKGYDELRQDLARMFGLEGQLDDTQRSEWKLVYVDHENDILLVGDDPWEEFVSCVQSIKILSEVEVQQISLG